MKADSTVSPSILPAETAMDLVRSKRAGRTVAHLLVAAFIAFGIILSVTPWQQSAPGSGRVVAYAPAGRQQNIEAPIEGRILHWFVREGSVVKKGDPIVDLTDNDPDIITRLQAERNAIFARLDAAHARALSTEARVKALEHSRQSSIAAAESRIRMASQRIAAAKQALELSNATLHTAKINIERQRVLADKGVASQRQLELTQLEETKARTEVDRAQVTLAAAESEEIAITADRQKFANDGDAAINDARATQALAESEVANTSAELTRIEVRLARQSAQSIKSPDDGTVFRIIANGHAGEIVKAGDVLAVFVPTTADRAVELWISGNDMPLVQSGAKARIQFEGWPALQFSGWPSVAIGTFPGRVSFVDAADNGQGKFRAVIIPEEGSQWPAPIYLRQGVRTQGWVQLGQVKLGYELWRQFNGFPASLPYEPSSPASLGVSKEGAQK